MRRHLARIMSFVCVISLLILSVTGCSQKSNVKQNRKEKNEAIQLGLCFDSFVIERWLRDRDAFESKAKELGAEVTVQNANGDKQTQVNQIKYLIKKGVDTIVIIPIDCGYSKLRDVITQARNEGVKVISYDRLIGNVETDLYMSFDNSEVGRLMAKRLIAENPRGGKIVEIGGSRGDHNVVMVDDAFREEINKSNLNLVYSEYCKNWDAQYAGSYMEEALKKYPDLVGVMCGNDDLASQVAQVLAENQKLGSVSLVGQDADLLACQRIVEGTQSMTVHKSVEQLATAAAYFAVALAKNKNITKENDIDSDGTMDGYVVEQKADNGNCVVNSYTIAPQEVIKSNIDSVIIDSGFHTSEEVYLNVQ